MGKSYRNPGKLAGAWEVQVQRPLDDRHAVDTVDDLTNADTWKGSDGNYYHYNTMVVVVKSESRMYVYRGETGNVAAVQDPDNWVADGKSAKRSTITPERDESGDFDFAFEITPETNAGVIDWRGNQSTLCIVANECPNEILVYFDGENPIADFAEYRIGEVPDFESGKMYVASYLDGIVAIAEVQPV